MPVSPSPYALITLTEAKEYLKVEFTDEDDVIQRLINMASDEIQHEYGSYIAKHVVTNEHHDGEGDNFLILRNFPVISVEKLTVSNEVVDPANYYNVADKGLITYQGIFPKGIGNIKVDYTAGYDILKVPERFKRWCYKLVSDMYEDRGGDEDAF